MNRIEMAELIKAQVLTLAVEHSKDWIRFEKIRKSFVSDYPIEMISSLSLDEYVIGKGADNKSFCYRIEREMDQLGRILGATSFKFGVYFGKTRREQEKKYRYASHWGDDVETAFKTVKTSIVNLLEAAKIDEYGAIAQNRLSPMFKGKLLFIYYPNKYAPIYSYPHLEHFIAQLNLTGHFKSNTDMQRKLMEYRATWPQLTAYPTHLFGRLLYDLFGYPSTHSIESQVPLLDEALNGCVIIDQFPVTSSRPILKNDGVSKHNYTDLYKKLKRIGDRGEAIVINLEKRRLYDEGRSELVGKIKHIADVDDSAGYDILSFNADGSERYIEVKATSSDSIDRGFFISNNEREMSQNAHNYYVYFVFSAMSKNPSVKIFHGNLENYFKLVPIVYHGELK